MKRFVGISGLVDGTGSGLQVAVPPTGPTAWLTTATAGAMAFLAVFALALSLATNRLADRWSSELARTATLRISAPDAQLPTQIAAAEAVLATTPGVASFRTLSDAEEQALLLPWFGPDLPLDSLPIPKLIEIVEDDEGLDAAALRLRLAAEVPGALLDDHTRWRAPLVQAADRLRLFATLSMVLIVVTLGGMVTLAANASLAANGQVIRVMRLIGAKDSFIARAFVRRFSLRALIGATIGALAGILAVATLPSASTEGGFLTGLGFVGFGWILPLLIPPVAGVVAYVATRAAAARTLRAMT